MNLEIRTNMHDMVGNVVLIALNLINNAMIHGDLTPRGRQGFCDEVIEIAAEGQEKILGPLQKL